MNLGDIKLSEIRQTQMNKCCLKYMGAGKVNFLRSREYNGGKGLGEVPTK